MRTKLSIGILLLFCLAEIKTYLPLLEYTLHFEYISEVLCINKDNLLSDCLGMCYVSDKLKKAQDPQNGDQKIPVLEIESILIIKCGFEFPRILDQPTALKNNINGYTLLPKGLNIKPPSPPPRRKLIL